MAIPPSHSQSTLPGRNILLLDSTEELDSGFRINVHVDQVPRCPACRRVSRSFHSAYMRTLHDLPWQGRAVQLCIRVRRFRCRNRRCGRKVFAERLPDVVERFGRRTTRLTEIIRLIGHTAGGLPGSRILNRLAIAISDDTVIRTVKHRAQASSSETEPVRYLGVDDWAWRKGQHYGTILVDLERHRVVDLLPGRCAEELKLWLQERGTVEVISRDRCGIYAEGAAAGAPDAVQVADRFHLLVNLSAAIERALEGRRPELRIADLASDEIEYIQRSGAIAKPTQLQMRGDERRQRRLERYEKVVELYGLGYSQRAISESLNMQRKTVRRWLRAGQFPERKQPTRKPLKVEDHASYLQQRWNEGCHNATMLYREIRSRGYKGGRSMVARFVSNWRKSGKPTRRQAPKAIAPKHAAILACKPPEQLTNQQHQLIEQLVSNCSELRLMRALAEEFRAALLGNDSSVLLQWIRTATQSGIGPLVRFAFGLKKDLAAVIAAVETAWSSGQVEGQVNRLKTIKRQMYGRAGFQLLRSRVLPFAPTRSP